MSHALNDPPAPISDVRSRAKFYQSLVTLLWSLTAASVTFGFTQMEKSAEVRQLTVKSISEIKDVSDEVHVNKAVLDGQTEDLKLLRKQCEDMQLQTEKRINYIVTLFEANQKTTQELINQLKVQNDIMLKKVGL